MGSSFKNKDSHSFQAHDFKILHTPTCKSAIMKIHYIGIIKNESKPSHELCAEKDLTAYSRFTRNK